MKEGVDRPGIYTSMSAADYHADPCPTPSLSASVAHELLQSSPRHAWFAHPRLNAAYEPEHDEKLDRGTAAHAYLLEGETGFVLIDAPDFRSKVAKDMRDAAYAAGKVPLLAHRWAEVIAMVDAAKKQLDAHQDPPRPLAAGRAEPVLIWQDDGVWCRARLDWLHGPGDVIDDYKTTSASANPDSWMRGPLFSMGYDIQAAFYLRGLRAVTGKTAVFRFIVQESFPPFALSVIGLSEEILTLADRKVRTAIAAWQQCLETNTWPGYPTRTCWAELPPWEETRWLEREARAAYPVPPPVVDDGRSLATQLFGEDNEDH